MLPTHESLRKKNEMNLAQPASADEQQEANAKGWKTSDVPPHTHTLTRDSCPCAAHSWRAGELGICG